MRRQRHFSFGTRRGGPEVNEPMPLPESPGPWVNEVNCVCEAHPGLYKNYNSRVTFEEAADYVRKWNEDNGNTEGGWRSRGPVLHAMRVLKLERWYAVHGGCSVAIPEDPDEWDALVWDIYDQAVDSGYDGSPLDFAELSNDDDAEALEVGGEWMAAQDDGESWDDFDDLF